MNIKTSILTVAAAVAIVFAGAAGATGLASAQDAGATPGQAQRQKRMERRDNFLGRVAANLGVTLDQVKQAFKQAATGAVDDALAKGQITKAQADKAKARIESGQAPGLRKLLGARQRARLVRLREGIVRSTATALGITPKELRTQLMAGQSIAQVAGAKIDAVKTQIRSDAAAKLDAAVAANKLTRPRADELLKKLTDNLDSILNKTRSQGQPSTR